MPTRHARLAGALALQGPAAGDGRGDVRGDVRGDARGDALRPTVISRVRDRSGGRLSPAAARVTWRHGSGQSAASCHVTRSGPIARTRSGRS